MLHSSWKIVIAHVVVQLQTRPGAVVPAPLAARNGFVLVFTVIILSVAHVVASFSAIRTTRKVIGSFRIDLAVVLELSPDDVTNIA